MHGPDKGSVDWFMPMMERYGIKGVVMSDFSSFYYNDDLRKGPDNVFKVAETCAKRFSKYSALLAYTPRDEPGCWNAQHTNYFCEVLRRFDPNHGMVAVMQPTFYQTYVDDTRLEAVCTDIYHFGGEGSRWIPSPRTTSQKTFRRTVHNAVTAAARVGKHAWIMPQAFGNTWGRIIGTSKAAIGRFRGPTSIGACRRRKNAAGRSGRLREAARRASSSIS